ncbi:hypothetical protein CTI12_AA544680 [Artemisia annua]|uniref:UspA domain-containing protein n=1 Tax=Artemisia annua TaxID=35608 RepID=A0A2U1KZV3_ARTAN|nr:hypothetical protein CTI12_AA544680 [Artemisia annua]
MENARKVGVAVDFSTCSRAALQWAVDNVVRKGDHLILVNVHPEGHYKETEMQLWALTGSPLIPLSEIRDAHVMKKYGIKPDPETVDIISLAAAQKEVTYPFHIYEYIQMLKRLSVWL